jgi:hypothetical protein
MKRRIGCVTAVVVVLGVFCWPQSGRAEHFDITLGVKTVEDEARAGWDTEPPVGGVNPRPVAHARVGEPVQIEWLMRSAYPHGVMKQVSVHFFVVREDAAGQKSVPAKTVPRLVENEFVMDYRPDYAAKGYVEVVVPRPGTYLVRLESEHTEQEHGHEHFSAVDLQVE